MREILFRGKRTDNGKWIEGGYFYDDERAFIIAQIQYIPDTRDWDTVEFYEKHPVYVIDQIEVTPETVGQFTGLTDKNGKKIFEGDIIKAMMDYGPAGLYERIVPIKRLNNVGYQWEYFDVPTIEIIGNIHDNPELLEVK